MIAHTIDAAQACGRFEKIFVSSDDDEILAIASKHGGSPHKRPSALAEPDVPTAPVLNDVIEQEAAQGRRWDVLACLYATAPLRTAQDIANVVDLIEPGICDYAMAVCRSERPVHQALTQTAEGNLEPVFPDMIMSNSQDVPAYFFGNGSTYAVSVPAFQQTGNLYGPGLRGYVMPRSRSVDLDTEDDLALLTFYSEISAP